MTRSIACGSSVDEGGGGGANSSSSPPSSLWLFGRARPSTRTPPLPSIRSATVREPISGSDARNRSRRAPAASSGTRSRVTNGAGAAWLTFRAEQSREQDEHADDDERVGEVECGPIPKVEEVGHVAEPHPVEEIGEAAADHEPQRHREYGMAGAGSGEEEEHPRDGDACREDDDGGRAREEAERNPRVLHVVDPERADDVHRLVEGEVARDQVLRQLVGGDRPERDRGSRRPLPHSAAE